VADPIYYSNGPGGSSGTTLATLASLNMPGAIWYVHHTGSDAASPRGKDRSRPLATIGQAFTNSGAEDWIVCLAGHVESISTTVTLSGSRIVIGEGVGASRPRLSRTADIAVFDLNNSGSRVENFYFPAATTAKTASRVKMQASGCTVANCYFECSGFDGGASAVNFLSASAINCAVTDTTFISTATSPTSQPFGAIDVGAAITDLTLSGVVFDGGTTGWSNQFALNGTANITRLRAWNIDLLGDSDMLLTTGTTGFVGIRNKSGSSRLVWP
jgi:hypothetical protein